jgi:hypothetical protein
LFGLLIVDLTLSYLVLCPFQTTTGLRGARKLQNGIVGASSQGLTDSLSSILLVAAPGGTVMSSGFGTALGTSNGFIYSGSGQALASGSSGGNSSALNDLTVLGGGMTSGTLNSVGSGGGAAGGNAVFGPSFAGAIAATPAATPLQFNEGLPTGGGGGGFGEGTGSVFGTFINPTQTSGTGFANGSGSGVGSGVAVNNANEQAGGSGGGESLGQGQVAFDLNNATAANFLNSGSSFSSGGAGAYVGLNPPNPVIGGFFGGYVRN